MSREKAAPHPRVNNKVPQKEAATLSRLKKILTAPIKTLYLFSALLVILIVIYINADIKYVPQFFLKQTPEQKTISSSVTLTTISQMTTTSTDNDIVESSENELDETVIVSNIEAIRSAKEALTRDIKTKNSSQADAAFRTFIAFHSSVVANLNAGFLNNTDNQTVLNKTGGLRFALPAELHEKYGKSLLMLQKYKESGIGFKGLSEDMGWELEQDPDYVIQLARELKSDYSAFLIFYADETRYSLGMDANLNLTWDELRKKIIRFEGFAKQHKQLSEVETHIKPMIQTMLSFYLEGMDNTPAYRAYVGGSGKIDEELKTSYIAFLNENKNSEYYPLIQGIYNNLKERDFRLNKGLVAFIHSKKIDAFHGTSVQEYLEKTSF